jgi:small-conductance mechanosensitive channel
MILNQLRDWFVANQLGLLIGGVVAAATIAALLGLRWLGQRAVDRDPEHYTWKSIIGRAFARTSLIFIIVAAADAFGTYANLPHRLERVIDIAFIIAFALQGAVWARELILGLLARKIEGAQDGGTLANATALIRVLVSFTLFALALILILDNLGVNVTALVAGLGIGGIAIGLAAQGIFSDLFAALSIVFDKPFKRGDLIRYGDTTGTVERIGLKTTRLRALSGEQRVMANTKLLEQEIHNLAAGRKRRSTIAFGVIYQTGMDKLSKIPELAEAAVKSRKGCTFVRCTLSALGASSLDHELIYDAATIDPQVMAADRGAIMMHLLQTFAENEIDFAYPTQTTFTAAPDGTMIMPYAGPSRTER